jgi:hypothetical protein
MATPARFFKKIKNQTDDADGACAALPAFAAA